MAARGLVLKGVRIVSLALNLPGPAALLRLKALGARCVKVEPPGGDPMRHYNLAAYESLSRAVNVVKLDLKSDVGQSRLHRRLASTDVLLTSFRPSALRKLGLDAAALRQRWPALSCIEIVGAPGAAAEHPGHDLTYQAEAGLVSGQSLPPSLLADMAGALMASEAVLAAVLAQRTTGQGVHRRVALSDAAHWLAQPLHWGLTGPGQLLGGAHAGYQVYGCRDGRVALAALEPHFAATLGRVVGLAPLTPQDCLKPAAQQAVQAFMARHSCAELQALAHAHDLPLLTLPR